MKRFTPFGFSLIAILFAAAFILIPFRPSADTYFMLAALVALIAVARQSPAPVRSFWHRLAARTRDPVPSTT